MYTLLKGRQKVAPTAFKDQVTLCKAFFYVIQVVERNTVYLQGVLIGYKPPHQSARRYLQGSRNIDNRVRHYDTFFADSQSTPLPSQKTVELNRYRGNDIAGAIFLA